MHMTPVRLCFWLGIALLSAAAATTEAARAGLDSPSAPTSSGNARTGSEATPDQLSARIAALIGQLGDQSYLVRQAAQSELSRIGPEAFDALMVAEKNPDIEISSRAKYLVQQIRTQWIHDSDSPQVRRILDKYELLDDAGRLQALRQLEFLPREIGLAPLCRLIRFERSPLVAKFSALLIIGQPDASAHSFAARQKIIESNLAQNIGPGAQWVRAYLRFHDDPHAGGREVDKLVDAELAGLGPLTDDALRQNTLVLESRLVNVLEQVFNHRDRGLDVLQKLSPLVTVDADSVADFADLLVQHQAWPLVDQLAQQSATIFNADPALLYTWAHAHRAQGKTDESEKIAERAYQLIGNSAEEHGKMGQKLSRLGLVDAAEREYKHVIDASGQDTELTIDAQSLLAEMLHDQQRDEEAGKVLQKLVDAFDKDPAVLQRGKENGDNFPDLIRAQMHLYYACHAAAQNKVDDQRRELDAGAKADPTNADILIGLYETSAHDPVRRKQAMELIHAADKGFRESIAQQPSNQIPYNQDAWLIGNTEGDFDLAIQYSQNSIDLLKNSTDEMQTVEPGYLDTLAHCYAGKGDFENAVKFQARATEMDPHTQQIARALAQFKQELEKGQKEKPKSP
jgi:tetratricopeptide (TPR) repeat protein